MVGAKIYLQDVSINGRYQCQFLAVVPCYCENSPYYPFHIELHILLEDLCLTLEITSLLGEISQTLIRTLCSHFFVFLCSESF